jgi:hypothetical protein
MESRIFLRGIIQPSGRVVGFQIGNLGSWKLPGAIDLVCRVFVLRDSLRLLSELWSLTEASLSATGIAMVRERGKSVGSDEVGASVFYSISRHISPSYHWPYLCTIGIPLSYEVVCCKLSKSVPFAVTVWYRFIVKSRCLTLAASVPLSRHGDF